MSFEPVPGSSGSRLEALTLADHLAVVRRRVALALAVILLVPAVAYFVSRAQDPVYETSAQVLVGRANLAAALNGIPETAEPEREAATQARLARVPEIAERVLDDVAAPGLSVQEFLADSDVSASPTTDLLTFTVRNSDPALARELANAYAEEYTTYRQELESQGLLAMRNELRLQLSRLEEAGQEDSAAYSELTTRQQQLTAIEALESARAVVVERADQVDKVSPQPLRNAALGFGVGLLLAVGLVFAFEALDTRVRTVAEVQRELRRPILAEIPLFPRKVVKEGGVVTLTRPNSQEAEAFRILRTSFDFVNLEHQARSVVVTSSVSQEGKSVVAANLAVTLARAGRRVILCDLDARAPSIARLFGLVDRPGLTDVVLELSSLEQALVSIDVGLDEQAASGAGVNGRLPMLRVLTVGRAQPPNPGEFVASGRVAALIDELEGLADHVILDTPPILPFGDAAALSATADGVLFVARLETLKRPMLAAARRPLAASPAEFLGVVITNAEGGGEYTYDYVSSARRPASIEPPSPTASK